MQYVNKATIQRIKTVDKTRYYEVVDNTATTTLLPCNQFAPISVFNSTERYFQVGMTFEKTFTTYYMGEKDAFGLQETFPEKIIVPTDHYLKIRRIDESTNKVWYTVHSLSYDSKTEIEYAQKEMGYTCPAVDEHYQCQHCNAFISTQNNNGSQTFCGYYGGDVFPVMPQSGCSKCIEVKGRDRG